MAANKAAGGRSGRPVKGNLTSYKLKSGLRVWRGRITVGGKTHRFKLGEEPMLTEAEARVRLDAMAVMAALGGWTPPPATVPPATAAVPPAMTMTSSAAAAAAPLREPTFGQLCEE